MGKSLLILSYGQSNADCHNAGPAFDVPCMRDQRIVVPNDGYGFRGLAGRPRLRPISGFETGWSHTPAVQSIGIAAAGRYFLENPDTLFTRIIVRGAAKGGRPLCGYYNRGRSVDGIFLDPDGALSPILLDMCEDVDQMVTAANETDAPITDIVIPFFHGEADRAADRSAYVTVLNDMMNVIEDRLAHLGLPISWLMTQPSGTTGGYAGNAWACRMSMVDICDVRENAHFVTANYAYELFDAAHLSATSKALIGEVLGLRIAEVLANKPVSTPKIVSAHMAEYWIDLTFDAPAGLAFDTKTCPDAHVPHGFEIAGRSDQTVVSVELIAPDTIRIHCAKPLCQTQGQLQYAYSSNAGAKYNDVSTFPFGRGALCEDWQAQSEIIPSRSLRRWVPGFALSLEDMMQASVAA